MLEEGKTSKDDVKALKRFKLESACIFVPSVYGIYVSGQLSCDVIGCFKSNRWLSRDVL